MAAETEEWILRLVDQASGNAARMSAGLSSLDAAQLKTAESALALDRAQRSIGKAMAATFKDPNDLAAKQKLQDAQAKAAILAAKQQAKAAADAAKAKVKADKEAALIGKRGAVKDILGAEGGNLAAAAQAAGGPLASLAGRVQQVAGILGRVPPHIAAIIIGFVALTAVVTVTTAALYKMAAAALEVVAMRNQLLATFGALGGGGASGAKTLAIVEKLGVALPFATEKIAEWATGLQQAGLQGRALESAIKAVAAAEALIKGGGQAAQELLKTLALGGPAAMQLIATIKRGGPEARSQLAAMGLRVEDLAAALGMTVEQFKRANLSAKQMAEAVEKALARKAAGPLADLMLTFPVLIQKVREGFLSLFDRLGPAVRPFMRAVKELFSNFFRGGAVINALKPIVTAVLTTLFALATKAVKAITAIVAALSSAKKGTSVFSGALAVFKAAWSSVVTAVQLVLKVLAPVIAAVRQFLASETGLKVLRAVFTGIAIALLIVIAIVGALVALVVGAVALLALPFIVAGAAIVALISVVAELVSWVSGALSGIASAAWEAASGFIQGLVNGISAGASAVIAAVTSLANGALDAFKGIFGIRSPSRVMLEHGEENIAGAAATGVEKGADKFDASMQRLSPDGAGGKGGGKKGEGSGGPTFIFTNCNFGDSSEAVIRDVISKRWAEMAREAPEPEPAT